MAAPDGDPAALRAALARRDAEYEAATGQPSSRAAIAADAEWEALFLKLKAAERAAAEALRVEGGCGFYIPKRRRFCASRAAEGGGGYCSLHVRGDKLGKQQQEQEQRQQGGHQTDGDAAAAPGLKKKQNLKRRMKAMTNPQAQQHQVAVPLPAFSSLYADPSRPVFMDIGCAKGRFLQRLASEHALREAAAPSAPAAPPAALLPPACNFLGVEIFEPLVAEANKWAAASGLTNVAFLACNVNASLPTWAPRPLPQLRVVSVLFPDPWSRGRHAARRVVTAESVRLLAALLAPGAAVYCCSDVRPLAAEMQTLFLADGALFVLDEAAYSQFGTMTEGSSAPKAAAPSHKRSTPDTEPHGVETTADHKRVCRAAPAAAGFEHVFPAHQYAWDAAAAPSGGTAADEDDASGEEAAGFLAATKPMRWLAANPFGVPTERDLVCEAKWRPVYRFLVRRVQGHAGPNALD